MSETWVRFCGRLVPTPLRETAFDPAVADLEQERLIDPKAASAIGRLRYLLLVAGTALECRRLAGHGTVTRYATMHFSDGRVRRVVSVVARASRVFTRQPGLAAIVVATLALGTGANLTVFSIVNQFLLAPLPVPNASGLVRAHALAGDGSVDVVSYPDYAELRDALTTADLAAHAQPLARVGPVDAGEVRTVELVSGNYFRVLGLAPLAGRLIEDADDRVEGASPVVVLSAAYWRSHYGGSSSAIGQMLVINSTPLEIVGVAPERYRGTFSAHIVDLWAPLAMHTVVRPSGQVRDQRGWSWLSMIGRLRPVAGVVAAQSQANTFFADLTRRVPGRDGVVGGFAISTASPMAERDRRIFVPALSVAFAFTVLLLAVTCANLAGVMQARLAARRRELAIRRSLGAGRARLFGEWLSESLVLAIAGGLVGLVVARLAAAGLSAIKLPVALLGDLSFETALDWRVMIYALGVALVTGLLFGALPALRAGSLAPMSLLKDDGTAVAGGRRSARARRAMVFVQVTASVVLLLAAGLLTESLKNQRAFNPGFETSRLGLVNYDLRRQGIARAEWRSATERILERLRQMPNVVEADIATSLPLAPGQDRRAFIMSGYTPPDGRTFVPVNYNTVGSKFFQALGLSFVRGESWPTTLQPNGALAMVINETAARTFWRDSDPVGKTIQIWLPKGDGPTLTIAGVVSDSTYYEVGEAPRPFFYLPAEVQPPAAFNVLVRTTADPGPMIPQFARATAAVDKRFAPFLFGTFAELRGVPLFPMRMLAGATTAFGIIAILLTSIGLYGVVATLVTQRTREIGVRMALGARTVTVIGDVLRGALLMASAGACAGLVGGYFVAGQLRSWLFGVGRFDLTVYLAVAALAIGLALIAAAVPASRAARVDPVQALRS